MQKITFLLWFIILQLSLTGVQGNIIITIVNESDTSIELRFTLNDYELKSVEMDGKNYQYVYIPGLKYPPEAGMPLLPYLVKSLIIPDDARVEMEILEAKVSELNCDRILPKSADLSEIIPSKKENLFFNKIYEQDKWFPETCTALGYPYIFRDYTGITVSFLPFMFNPSLNRLKIVNSVIVRITFTGTSQRNKIIKKAKKSPLVFESLYRQHFINYSVSSSKYQPLLDEGDMVIITTEEFMTAVLPFANWKNKKGIKTTIVTYPAQTGSTPYDIKNYIQNLYNITGTLAYILIVGDAEDVPPHPGYAGSPGFEADPVYTLLAGNDEYPDAFIGRFSVENNLEAMKVIQKNINYEMTPNPFGEWYHKATGVASDCNFPPIGVDTAVMNQICDSMMAYHYTHFDKIYDPGASVNELISAINEGRSWLNYLGHGSAGGWATTGFNLSHISQLQNTNMNPVVISVACNTGDFGGVTCLAEAWQRAGTTAEPKGSIGFMGSSITQYNSATIGKLEMIHHLVNDNFFTLGGIMVNGMMESIDYYPGIGAGSGAECYQAWHLFGDPSLFIFSDTPAFMQLNCNAAPQPGDTSIYISVNNGTVPIRKALVAVSYNNQLIGSAYSDDSGMAEIIFTQPIGDISHLELTATAYNKMPVFDTVPVNIISNINNPEQSFILKVYPNPFSDKATIEIFVPEGYSNKVDLIFYDLNGGLIRKVNRSIDPSKSLRFDLAGDSLKPGIYFLVVQTGEFRRTEKFVVLPD